MVLLYIKFEMLDLHPHKM
uniref:Uncharacterized protein n=1 Tax=Arundo donax TaxID=35708 RepID=A0A0A9A9V8_ARUDO